MFLYKSMSGLTLSLALLFCLTCPFVTLVEAAAVDSGITTVDNDFIAIFGQAINTSKAETIEPVVESKELGATIKEMVENKRGLRSIKVAGPLSRIADSLGAFIILAIALLLFLFGNLSLAAFSFKSTEDDLKHYDLINSQVSNHKWLTLIAGLLNGGVLILVTLLLIKKMPLIGFILLAWGIGVTLQVLAARILSSTEEVDISSTVRSYRNVLKLTLCQLSIYIIPVYGQLEFLKTIIRGIGAKVLLKTGFGRKIVQAD